ncbi:hypothetical protein B0W44_05185 [Novibacillus thermophilus]|uniref:Sce7726 family protein n=1 Tax=Novibacillus thermophilus TaxID=1471761 RepID=A0A1U9KBF9_9BACL|nr:hypothetical protein B0W44_05185 [Novibacillus thermophilus]
MVKSRDVDIRKGLHYTLLKDHKNDPDTLVLDEMTICQGDARIDVAVINGKINGFEIKSESDTLERLPRQVDLYNMVFDTVTIVTGPRYIDGILDLIPDWWGIIKTEMDSDRQVYFYTIREAQNNYNSDPLAIAQLLWRNEALEILKEKGLHKGLLSKPRRVLWQALAEKLSIDELKDEVRKKLKNRSNWRGH